VPATGAKPADDALKGKEAGEVRDDNGLKIKLVWCPPGFVRMGDIDEEPVNAFVTRGYWIGKFEVTQLEWKRVMGTEPWNGKPFVKAGDDIPVTWVNWDDSLAFCRSLTEQEREAGRLPAGWEYTLPTEAQWERACRARTETMFSFGDDAAKLGDYAWTRDNAMNGGEQHAHPVGQKKPNPWGLYDMHGNVFEWCRDVYIQKLPGGRDPETTGEGSRRMFRGGSWCVEGSYCRSANRKWTPPQREYVALGVGFRVALCALPPAAR
jgi:formylglycine-generating enzyme required for sulfatase activity